MSANIDFPRLPGFELGLAEPRDLESLTSLIAELFELETEFTVDRERQARALELLFKAQAESRADILVARDESGRPAGMLTLQYVVSTAEGAPSAWIEDVVVTRSFRGKGIGTFLLEGAEVLARRRGATRFQLLCFGPNEAAMAFYDRQGWERSGMVLRRRGLKGEAAGPEAVDPVAE